MHETALRIGGIFFERYWRQDYSVVVEVGSYDVNGSLRKFQPSGSHWIGLDIECGPGVDVRIEPGGALPLRDASADIVLASSVLEHDDAFWVTFAELCRITKPGGLVYVNAPSNGEFHRYPRDSWRFYPDASRALAKWARSKGMEVTLFESFVADRAGGPWNDFVAIFGKGRAGPSAEDGYVHSHVPCRNVSRGDDSALLRHQVNTEDMERLRDQASAIAELTAAQTLDQIERGLLERHFSVDRGNGRPQAALPRLFTTHGTVVYVEPSSGELRHGHVDHAPRNTFLVSHAGGARIVHATGGELVPVACPVDPLRAIVRTDGGVPASEFQTIQLRRDWVGLRSAGHFLCAESDGRVTLSRNSCQAWESFLVSDRLFRTNARSSSVTGSLPTLTDRLLPKAGWPPQGTEAPGAARPGRFARRRAIVVRHRGNLANKMLQYMGALTLASRIKGARIVNVSIPEWGIEIPDDSQHDLFFDNVDLWTWDAFRPHVEDLCATANRSESIRIMMADHLQRMEFLMDPRAYQAVFPRSPPSIALGEDDLLINIRGAEILDGVPHYPLVPVAFYEDVVARSGLNPVFMGQLMPSRYLQELRDRFPGARFIDSQGPRADFDLIRSAKHVVVAVSTFSWLAAWLSEAATIYVPLAGFFNPAHHCEIDLLPVDDIRFRYFLFPLTYGMPEEESLQHHRRIVGRWKEVSRNQVAVLKSGSPFLRIPRENYDSGLPSRISRAPAITFDPVWYAHQYVDAAMEISEGWFEDPLHHYLEVGRLRGYLPVPPTRLEAPLDLSLPNLALGRPATQSSVSEWSKGSTVEADAGHAVNGDPAKDYGFHTALDANPWWMVDLGAPAKVHFLRVFNRQFVPDWMQRRASPLVIEASLDGEAWTDLCRTRQGHLFGGYSGGSPLVWSSKVPAEARFVRISIPRREHLHLAEVEVYGHLMED